MFETVDNIIKRDPAARSRLQVILTYPGFRALKAYRLAHRLWNNHHLLMAEIISNWSRKRTGIDIHPGATIGERLFIDHGIGVVIGETAVIGNDVTILHGVTLGSRREVDGKRYPTVGDNVFIGTNALILGNITINNDAKVGAGAVVLKDVPENATAVGNPARILKQKEE